MPAGLGGRVTGLAGDVIFFSPSLVVGETDRDEVMPMGRVLASAGLAGSGNDSGLQWDRPPVLLTGAPVGAARHSGPRGPGGQQVGNKWAAQRNQGTAPASKHGNTLCFPQLSGFSSAIPFRGLKCSLACLARQSASLGTVILARPCSMPHPPTLQCCTAPDTAMPH